MSRYINIRIKKSTKKRIDVLSKYLGRSIIATIDDCVAGMQAKIMLNAIAERERQAKEKKDV